MDKAVRGKVGFNQQIFLTEKEFCKHIKAHIILRYFRFNKVSIMLRLLPAFQAVDPGLIPREHIFVCSGFT